jgi:AbrB family looped-hinge helix DNA binding protein
MRITSKGQVTIPQVVREKAGLHPGSEVEFTIEDGKVVLRRALAKHGEPAPSAVREAIRRARGTANNPMFKGWTTDQIMQFLRGED